MADHDDHRLLRTAEGLVPVPDPTKLTTEAVIAIKNELIYIIDLRFAALELLLSEKFKGIAAESTMRDTAVVAAFKAADTAVDKSGAAFTKQIDGLGDKINDLKERTTVMESRTAGIATATTEYRSNRFEAHNQQIDIRGNIALIVSMIAIAVSFTVSWLSKVH